VTTLLELLTEAWPVPSPTTEEQVTRYYHYDVPSLTSLDRERELAIVRLIVFLGGHEWYAEREMVLEGAA